VTTVITKCHTLSCAGSAIEVHWLLWIDLYCYISNLVKCWSWLLICCVFDLQRTENMIMKCTLVTWFTVYYQGGAYRI